MAERAPFGLRARPPSWSSTFDARVGGRPRRPPVAARPAGHAAAQRRGEGGHLGVAEKLLEARAGPLDYVDEDGRPPLRGERRAHRDRDDARQGGRAGRETRGGVPLEALNAMAAAAVAALVKEMSASRRRWG